MQLFVAAVEQNIKDADGRVRSIRERRKWLIIATLRTF